MEEELINLIRYNGVNSPPPDYERIRQILRTAEGRRLVNTIRMPGTGERLITYVLKRHEVQFKIILKLLIKAGADINSVDHAPSAPPMVTSINSNNTDGLIELIEAGIDVNARLSIKNNTALMFAAAALSKSMVKELIKAGANVNLQDSDRKTALDFAKSIYSLDIYDILVNAGAVFGDAAKISNKEGAMKKHVHIYRDDLAMMLEYRDEGKDISTPLIRAVDNNNTEIFNTLLSQGVDVNLSEYDGMTPLIHACLKNNLLMVNRLIEAGADINKQNIYGNTALHMAAKFSNIEIIFDLLSAGADPFAINKFGDTPLDRAIFLKRERPIIDALKRAMNEIVLTTSDAYLRSRLDTSGLGPTPETPLRGIDQNVWGNDMVLEQVFNMAYGDGAGGRRKSKSTKRKSKSKTTKRKSKRKSKSKTTKRKSKSKRKSKPRKKNSLRKKSKLKKN